MTQCGVAPVMVLLGSLLVTKTCTQQLQQTVKEALPCMQNGLSRLWGVQHPDHFGRRAATGHT